MAKNHFKNIQSKLAPAGLTALGSVAAALIVDQVFPKVDFINKLDPKIKAGLPSLVGLGLEIALPKNAMVASVANGMYGFSGVALYSQLVHPDAAGAPATTNVVKMIGALPPGSLLSRLAPRTNFSKVNGTGQPVSKNYVAGTEQPVSKNYIAGYDEIDFGLPYAA